MKIKLALVLMSLILFGCDKKEKCIIGQKYVTRFIFNEENPFEKARYDTVIVLDIQNGYVKYRSMKRPFFSYYSGKVEYFLEDSKIIK